MSFTLDLPTQFEGLWDNGKSLMCLATALEMMCDEKAAFVAAGGSHGSPDRHMAREWRKAAAIFRNAAKALEPINL